MPKQVSQLELDALQRIVADFATGVSVQQISRALATDMPRRTLQRRLALLVEQQRLSVSGRGRGTRYQQPATLQVESSAHSHRVGEVNTEPYVPISAESEIIRALIRRPIHLRSPVSYNREFLDSYRPNQTCYLPPDTRAQLAEMGRGGGAQSPAGTYARQMLSRLLIDLSWNSSRLEGNTYSLLETERLLEQGQSAEGKNALEAQMIINHKAAIEFLVDQAHTVGFNRDTVLNLHALLADNLLADPRAQGRLRKITVGVSGTVYEPLAVPQLIEECFLQVLDTATAIIDPFEQAFFAMVHLPYLQPFEDVNKRVSRLAANLPLIRQNLSPLSFVDVPERAYIEGILGVYELNRVELLRDVFVWAYQRSCARYSAVRQSLGEPDLFRLQYRQPIYELVAAVVKAPMSKPAAIRWIVGESEKKVPANQCPRLIEVVEAELSGLHIGNIARYRISPAEFEAWHKGWQL